MKILTNTPKKWLASSAALGLLTLLLSSCIKDNNTYYNPPPVAYAGFIQASPGEPALNFSLNSDVVNSFPLNFGNSIGYFRAYTGARAVNVTNASTGASVLSSPVTLNANQYYSLFLANTTTAPQLVVLNDTLTQPASGKAIVRFVNLGPDAPAVDLVIQGGATVASNVAFKGFSPFTTVTSGSSYNLEVVDTGTSTVVASLPNTALSAGFVYTIWLQGLINTTVTGQKTGINMTVNAAYNY